MNRYFTLNNITQFGLVFFTVLGFLFTGMKMPQYGLILNLIAQVFWLSSSYKAWRQANQIGIFINTIILTLVVLYGVINYWVL